MTLEQFSWDLFARTGDVNAYLLYKSERQLGSMTDGKHQNERLDYKKHELR